jgi:hypothetical protein
MGEARLRIPPSGWLSRATRRFAPLKRTYQGFAGAECGTNYVSNDHFEVRSINMIDSAQR